MYAKKHYLKQIVPMTASKTRELHIHCGRICPKVPGKPGLIPGYSAQEFKFFEFFLTSKRIALRRAP